MNALLQKASVVNRNGAICGLSLPYSTNLTEFERVRLAADVVTEAVSFIPSIAQAAPIFGVTAGKISDELERRAAQQRVEQVKRLAETLRCLPAPQCDAVIKAAGVVIWDSLDRLTR